MNNQKFKNSGISDRIGSGEKAGNGANFKKRTGSTIVLSACFLRSVCIREQIIDVTLPHLPLGRGRDFSIDSSKIRDERKDREKSLEKLRPACNRSIIRRLRKLVG